jgi:hypothetical protein
MINHVISTAPADKIINPPITPPIIAPIRDPEGELVGVL